MFVGALYHPPRPTYTTDALLNYTEATVDELNWEFPSASIVLAGDFNQLSDHDVTERTCLTQIVHQKTRGQNVLDRIFVSRPMFCTVRLRVVISITRSDHRDIVAYTEPPSLTLSKHIDQRRRRNMHSFCFICLEKVLPTTTVTRPVQIYRLNSTHSTKPLRSFSTDSILREQLLLPPGRGSILHYTCHKGEAPPEKSTVSCRADRRGERARATDWKRDCQSQPHQTKLYKF